MAINGKTCDGWTWGLQQYCTSENWRTNGYCQQACHDAGLGYTECCDLRDDVKAADSELPEWAIPVAVVGGIFFLMGSLVGYKLRGERGKRMRSRLRSSVALSFRQVRAATAVPPPRPAGVFAREFGLAWIGGLALLRHRWAWR